MCRWLVCLVLVVVGFILADSHDVRSQDSAFAKVGQIASFGRVTSQSATSVAFTSFRSASSSSFRVSGYALITSYTSGNLSIQCHYTDVNGGAQVVPLQGYFASSYGTMASGLGAFTCQPVQIHVQAGSTITMQSSGTFTAVYHAESVIELLSN